MLAIGLLVFTGCSTTSRLPVGEQIPPLHIEGETYNAHRAAAIHPDINPLAIDPSVEELLDHELNPNDTTYKKVRDINALILEPNKLAIGYDTLVTGTAQETLDNKIANCVGYSHLFIAMARYAGMDAHYQEVEIKPTWRKQGEWLVSSRHINVYGRADRLGDYHSDIDLSVRYRTLSSRPISDESALALHYNNIAMDHLVAGRSLDAFSYLSKALLADHQREDLWANLGTIFKRNNQLEAAKWSYRRALKEKPGFSTAIVHLLSVAELEEDTTEIERLNRKLKRLYRTNPWFYAQQAHAAINDNRWPDALKSIQRAIDMLESEFEFYLTAYQIALRTDNQALVTEYLARAQELAIDRQHELIEQATEIQQQFLQSQQPTTLR